VKNDRKVKPVIVTRGEVMGIGKAKFPRKDAFNYEIPIFSFVVIKEPDGGFVASCIHLHIDGYGTTEEAAMDDMLDTIDTFLWSNFEKLESANAWDNLIELSKIDEDTKELWDAYRHVQFRLAERNISAEDEVEHLKKRIGHLQQQKEMLEKEMERQGKHAAEPVIDPFILEYQYLKVAA